MFEIKTIQDLESFLLFPLVTFRNTIQFSQVSFSFTNIANDTKYAVNTLTLSIAPNTVIQNCTFLQLKSYLNIQDIQRLENCLNLVYHNSDLYENSIIRLDITMQSQSLETHNNGLTVSRYFSIPSITRTQDIIPVSMQLNGHVLNYGFSIPTTLSGPNVILSTTLTFVIRTQWTDLLIYSGDFIQEKTVLHQINVAGYDMTSLMVFLTGNQMNNQSTTLLGYKILDQSMILVPSVSMSKDGTTSDGTTKSCKFGVNIAAQVFDGLDYEDYGYLFYNNGFSMNITEFSDGTLNLQEKGLLGNA